MDDDLLKVGLKKFKSKSSYPKFASSTSFFMKIKAFLKKKDQTQAPFRYWFLILELCSTIF